MGKAMGKEKVKEKVKEKITEDCWTLEAVLSHIEVIYNVYETGRERADRMLQFTRQVKEIIKKPLDE